MARRERVQSTSCPLAQPEFAKSGDRSEVPKKTQPTGHVADRQKRARPCYFFCISALIHAVLTDFGRVIGVPIARFRMSCANMPIARDTLNSTV